MKARVSPFLLAAAAGALFSAGAVRAEEGAPSYTMEDVTACSGDAMRFCRHHMPSIKAIEDCMRANYASLQPKCQARFKGR